MIIMIINNHHHHLPWQSCYSFVEGVQWRWHFLFTPRVPDRTPLTFSSNEMSHCGGKDVSEGTLSHSESGIWSFLQRIPAIIIIIIIVTAIRDLRIFCSFLQLLLLHYTTTASVREIQANCPDQAVLQCASDDLGPVSFLAVSWYKVRERNNIHRHAGRVFVPKMCVC